MKQVEHSGITPWIIIAQVLGPEKKDFFLILICMHYLVHV